MTVTTATALLDRYGADADMLGFDAGTLDIPQAPDPSEGEKRALLVKILAAAMYLQATPQTIAKWERRGFPASVRERLAADLVEEEVDDLLALIEAVQQGALGGGGR